MGVLCYDDGSNVLLQKVAWLHRVTAHSLWWKKILNRIKHSFLIAAVRFFLSFSVCGVVTLIGKHVFFPLPQTVGQLYIPSSPACCFWGKSPIQHFRALSTPAVKFKIHRGHKSFRRGETSRCRVNVGKTVTKHKGKECDGHKWDWFMPTRPQGMRDVGLCKFVKCKSAVWEGSEESLTVEPRKWWFCDWRVSWVFVWQD